MVESVPEPQRQRHCWVWNYWPPRGDPVPGIIIGWHLAPTASAISSPWMMQVAIQRAPRNLVVQWIAAQNIAPVTDDTATTAADAKPGTRHVWLKPLADRLPATPGLILDWRHDNTGWQAHVARAHGTDLLVDWTTADTIAPVADPGWTMPEVRRTPKPSRRR